MDRRSAAGREFTEAKVHSQKSRDRMSHGAITMNSLAKYNDARAALERAHTVDEVKDIRDKAEALRAYAKQANDIDMQNWAAEIRVRAERRAGELLREMAETGTRHSGRGDQKSESRPPTPKLSDLGISKDHASQWQRLADVPTPEFESKLRSIMGLGKELTTTAMMKAITPANKETKIDWQDELLKRLSPLLPIGADGQPRLAELIDQAKAVDGDFDTDKMRTAINMLNEISEHFAASAKALEDRNQFAKVA
jgi:hypothetical protein